MEGKGEKGQKWDFSENKTGKEERKEGREEEEKLKIKITKKLKNKTWLTASTGKMYSTNCGDLQETLVFSKVSKGCLGTWIYHVQKMTLGNMLASPFLLTASTPSHYSNLCAPPTESFVLLKTSVTL